MRLSVRWKIISLTVLIFLAVTAVTTYLSIRAQKQMVLRSAERHAEDLADGYFDVLNTMMLTGTINNREIIRQKLERNPEIVSVRPIRSEHINQQFPGDHADEAPQDALDHRALKGERVVDLAENDGMRTLTIVKPAIARPKLPGETLACTNCHTVDEGTVLGAVRLEFSLADRDDQIHQQTNQTLMLNLALLLLGLGLLALFMNSLIVKPIKRLQVIMGNLARGDLSQRTIAARRQDEIGDIARSIDDLSTTLGTDIGEIQQRANTLSQRSEALIQVSGLLVGNAVQLAQQTQDTLQSTTDVGAQTQRMTQAADGIAHAVSDVLQAAQHVAQSMGEVTNATRDVEQSITSIATSSEQMRSTIHEIASNSQQTQELTNNAASALEKGVARIHDLAITTRKIEDVVREVEEIAELTQNLALNAHIEAAKAGNAGAGFRVVAEEVRSLAKQTSTATEDIQDRVAAILNVTQEVVGEIENVNRMVANIKDKISDVASAVEEQSVTTTSNVDHIQAMVSAIKGVAGNVDRAEGASSNIATQIEGVAKQAERVNNSASNTQANTQQIIGSIQQVGNISATEKDHAQTVSSAANELSETAERLKTMIAKFKLPKN